MHNDSFDKQFDSTFKMAKGIAVLAVIAQLAFFGLIGWGIYELVTWITA